MIRYCIYRWFQCCVWILDRANYEAHSERIKTKGMLHNYADMLVVVVYISSVWKPMSLLACIRVQYFTDGVPHKWKWTKHFFFFFSFGSRHFLKSKPKPTWTDEKSKWKVKLLLTKQKPLNRLSDTAVQTNKQKRKILTCWPVLFV